ncbi:protease complex subunit PrcB family protein [Thiohalospira sp.]|uniref:protease complex subunit PrcB family protein n=1 Tax=Thiohalospira sp. TaxID=3080549 RepID=UPI0039819267
MFNTRKSQRTLPALAALLVAACSSGGSGAAGPEPAAESREAAKPTRVAARVIYKGTDCGARGPSPAVTWIDDPGARERLVRRLEDNAPDEPEDLPAIDFRSHGLVFIEMGRRATTGYSLELATPRVLVQPDGHARLEVSAHRPSAGTVTSPTITYPCLVARVPRADFDRLSVVDDEGRTWGTARVD